MLLLQDEQEKKALTNEQEEALRNIKIKVIYGLPNGADVYPCLVVKNIAIDNFVVSYNTDKNNGMRDFIEKKTLVNEKGLGNIVDKLIVLGATPEQFSSFLRKESELNLYFNVGSFWDAEFSGVVDSLKKRYNPNGYGRL